MPRLTALKAHGDEAEFRRIYRAATALITALVTPAGMVLALFGGEIMWIWTGDRALADQAAPILRWYALGNACLAVTSFTYYLQYAHGDLKRHTVGNLIFAVVLAPAIIIAATRYGGVGAGEVWFAANVLYLLGWTLFVHSRFAPGLHWSWLGRNVVLVALPALAVLFGLRFLSFEWYESRWLDLLKLALAGVAALGLGGLLIPGAPAVLASALRMARARVRA
jgi:O-antigen/teichoic acid export membrane protein